MAGNDKFGIDARSANHIELFWFQSAMLLIVMNLHLKHHRWIILREFHILAILVDEHRCYAR